MLDGSAAGVADVADSGGVAGVADAVVADAVAGVALDFAGRGCGHFCFVFDWKSGDVQSQYL